MCLAVPSKVVSVDGLNAEIEASGARTGISLMLMPEPVEVGEYVIVHAGFAIQKIDEEAALESHRLIREMIAQLETEGALGDEDDYMRPPTGRA
jgi:hydrogenase expression/formation protein HypC